MDPEIEKCMTILLKKATDTNLFIAEAAQTALSKMCIHTTESKVIHSLLPHSDQKSAIIRT